MFRLMVAVWLVFCFVSAEICSQEPCFKWGRQVGGPAEDFGKSIGVDGSGNVYITGWTQSNLGGTYFGKLDVFLYKFNKHGKMLWVRQMGTQEDEQVQELCVDAAGNCYITGATTGNLGGANKGEGDVFIIKYDTSGNHVWTKQMGTDQMDFGEYIVLDSAGNIYVTGHTRGDFGGKNAGNKDVFFLKCDPAGNLIFNQQFGGKENDVGRGIAFDNKDRAYVCGAVNGDWTKPTPNMDAFVAVYTKRGDHIETNRFGSKDLDLGANIQVDDQGFIYLGGSTNGSLGGPQAGNGDGFLMKIGANKKPVWIKQFGRKNWDGVLCVFLLRDGSGRILISGCQNWPACEGYCRMYNANGDLLWKREFVAKVGQQGSCGKDAVIDANDNLYHVGGTKGGMFVENMGFHDAYLVRMPLRRLN